MFHALSKKSKLKSQRNEVSRDTERGVLENETKFSPKDPLRQRKSLCKKDTSMRVVNKDGRFGASSQRSCSAMVTFESIKPTQIWQTSASPSPPIAPTTTEPRVKPKCSMDSLALSMITQTTNDIQWSLSTGDEDDLSDSTDDDAGDERGKCRRWESDRRKKASTPSTFVLQSSPSSSDSSSSFEMSPSSIMSSRHRQKKQPSLRHRRENVSFSSGSRSTSSESSKCNSSVEELNLFWKLNTGGIVRSSAPTQSALHSKPTPHPQQQYLLLPPGGTPQVKPRYHATHQRNRPHILHVSGNAFSQTTPFQSPSKSPPDVQTIARAVEDFFPTLEWIEKYKVIGVRRGDLLRIVLYPGTNLDKMSLTTGWFLAQKWCPDHGSCTGPIGFVPRILCDFFGLANAPQMSHISSRHTGLQDYISNMTNAHTFMTTTPNLIQITPRGELNAASKVCDMELEPTSNPCVYPSPRLSLRTPTSNSAITKTSFTSVPAVYEIEDQDSGRGPSSGSEWSSGKGGSLSGATDINVDEKDHPRLKSQLQQYQKVFINKPFLKLPSTGSNQRRASKDEHSRSEFACPVPPVPMTLLSHVWKGTFENKLMPSSLSAGPKCSVSDTEAADSICSLSGTQTRLYVRTTKLASAAEGMTKVSQERESGKEDEGKSLTSEDPGDQRKEREISESPQSMVVVVSSNSDAAHWEPYKTMIQLGQHNLEKFTLV